MKKYILFISIAGSIFLPFTTMAEVNTNLSYGSKGDEVIELQKFLINRGYLNVPVTGNFYSGTFKAVKNFQEAQGLPSTGYVGILTRNLINNYSETISTSTKISASICPKNYVCKSTQEIQSTSTNTTPSIQISPTPNYAAGQGYATGSIPVLTPIAPNGSIKQEAIDPNGPPCTEWSASADTNGNIIEKCTRFSNSPYTISNPNGSRTVVDGVCQTTYIGNQVINRACGN